MNRFIEHDDGVIHSTHLTRDGDRIHRPYEPWTWWDISDGAPRVDHDEGKAPDDYSVREFNRPTHQDAPRTTYWGWTRGDNGWVLLSTSGTSWTPEAFVPHES